MLLVPVTGAARSDMAGVGSADADTSSETGHSWPEVSIVRQLWLSRLPGSARVSTTARRLRVPTAFEERFFVTPPRRPPRDPKRRRDEGRRHRRAPADESPNRTSLAGPRVGAFWKPGNPA